MNAEQFHDALSQRPSDLITETDKVRAQPRTAVIPLRHWVSVAACAVLILGCGFFLFNRLLPAMNGSSSECAADTAMEEKYMLSGSANSDDSIAAEAQEPQAAEAASGSSNSRDTAEAESSMEEGALTPTGYPADSASFIDLSAAQTCLTNLLPNVTLNVDSSQAILIQSREELDACTQEWADYYELYSFQEACEAYDDGWFEGNDLLLLRIATEKSERMPVIDAFTLTGPESCEVTISFAVFPEDRTPDPACWHILLPTQKGLLTGSTIINIECP